MRLIPAYAAFAALLAALPAFAADYPEFRPAYADDWSNDPQDDSIRFEFGTRYWYSWGNQDAGFTATSGGFPLGDVTITERDTTHFGELYGKIEDLSTQTYVKGQAGIGFATNGTYAIAPANSGSIGANSSIGYVGADFGWLPLGTIETGAAIGPLIGYQYWKDAPDIGTGKYVASFDGTGTPATFGDAKDNFDIHALRLGIEGQVDMGSFDIQGEVAAVPYAYVTGEVGGSAPNGFAFTNAPGVTFYQDAPTTLSGHGYGAMGELLVGFHPTENLAIRVGGRAWYVQGDLTAAFSNTAVAGGANLGSQTLNIPSNFARIFRYGALLEVTGKF